MLVSDVTRTHKQLLLCVSCVTRVLFDDIFNLMLYEILCIFNYMDEYNANHSNFIYQASTFSTMDDILAAVFVAEEHFPSFEPEM